MWLKMISEHLTQNHLGSSIKTVLCSMSKPVLDEALETICQVIQFK